MTKAPEHDDPAFVGMVLHDGCVAVYHIGETNRCPGCHKANWDVRELTATCGFCDTVLPLVRHSGPTPTSIKPLKTGE